MADESLGYRFDLEDKDWMRENSDHGWINQVAGRYSAPTIIDPRTWFKIRNQAAVSSCFVAGTLVTMATGDLVPIEEVNEGAEVLSHTGSSRRVMDSLRRSFTGKLYTFFAKGWGKVTMTEDHMAMVYRGGEVVRTEARNVREDDEMIISPGVMSNPSERIDLLNYIGCRVSQLKDGRVVSANGHRPIPRYFELSPENCFVLGLYVAEGNSCGRWCGSPYRTTFTFHSEEYILHNAVERFADHLGIDCYSHKAKHSKAHKVEIQCSVLASFFETACGKICNNKRVPEFILRGTAEQRMAFLQGYVAGDGSTRKFDNGRKAGSGNIVAARQICSKTASSVLWRQIGALYVGLGMKPGLSSSSPRPSQRFVNHMVYLYSQDAVDFAGREAGMYSGKAMPRPPRTCEFGQLRPIRSIEVTEVVDHPVYCLSVDVDRSFVVNGMCHFNCGGHGSTAVAEATFKVAAGDMDTDGDGVDYEQDERFSPGWAYIQAQKEDGINGDDGSTIAALSKVAVEQGYARERVSPYRGKYEPRAWVSPEAAADAAQFKMSRMKLFEADEWEQAYEWIYSGQGFLLFGTPWEPNWTSGFVIDGNPPTSMLGGHATGGIGIVPESIWRGNRNRPQSQVLRDNEEMLIVNANSHGVNAQQNGFFAWTKRGLQSFMRFEHSYRGQKVNMTSIAGLSDMETAKPRSFDWTKKSIFHPFDKE